MPKITYIDATGIERTVEGKNGMTVMETAIKHNIPGIDADCGGACACATCHVYVDQAFTDKVGKPSAMEQSMLDFAENVKENSRLSCQIKIREDLEGLRVTTPESQH
jgi:2Fe-2S ferredoxin